MAQRRPPIYRPGRLVLRHGPGVEPIEPEPQPQPVTRGTFLRKPRVTSKLPAKAKPKSTTSSVPLLPVTAAAFILLGGAQLAFWWWEAQLPDVTGSGTPAGNPFIAMARHDAAKADAVEPNTDTASKVKEAQRLTAPVLAQNLQFGDALARVTVTIFTDPACGPCREQVLRWTSQLPVEGVRQVYKFWPQDPSRLTPGLLVELARREGKTADFWRAIQGAGSTTLDDATLLTMLDHAGVPLADQRKALTDNSNELMAALEPDITTAKQANLPRPPVIMVDDYVLDGDVLSPGGLNGYVKKRLEGRELLDRNDLFLMRK